MHTICWDVDTQIDFIHADGALAVPGAEALPPRLKKLTDWAHRNDIIIVATADDHRLSDLEISDHPDWKTSFPPHCMAGTPGQGKIPETSLRNPLMIDDQPRPAAAIRSLVLQHSGDFYLTKSGTDVFEWNPNSSTVLTTLNPMRVIVYGVATDFCVRLAVEGLANWAAQADLVIVTDAIAAINAGDGAALVQGWKERGYRISSTAEITV